MWALPTDDGKARCSRALSTQFRSVTLGCDALTAVRGGDVALNCVNSGLSWAGTPGVMGEWESSRPERGTAQPL